MKNYGQMFMTLYQRQGSRPSPKRRNAKKKKILTFTNSNFISKIQMILIKRLFMVTYDEFNHFSIN